MSQKDNFGNGFVLGSIVGGVVGGILGTLLATKTETAVSRQKRVIKEGKPPIDFTSEQSIEYARHGLEDKIAQLNLAIDEVRQQLDSVNSNSVESESFD